MDFNKIKTIIYKEWAEVFRNRLVLFTVLFMPLFFAILPLIILGVTAGSGVEDSLSEVPPQFAQMCQDTLSGGECMQYFLVSQFLLLFMMMPVMIPVNIAAYSIVGEKTTRSLEPLLATPISTEELLGGKMLAAVIPAVAATWLGFGLFTTGAYLITRSDDLMAALFDPLWLIAIFLVGPLLAVLAVNFAIMVSSRVNDPRVAEQLSVVVILPVLLLFLGQIGGLLVVNRQLIWLLTLLVIVIDILLIPITVRLFQRESILTRWR